MTRAFVLTDLGYGDAGKGTTTHWLSHQTAAHTVVRTGGAQASHNVVTAAGTEYTFQQFGSGTLSGARTYLSRFMVVDPFALLIEGRELLELGIDDCFGRLEIDGDALIITPPQAIANRLLERSRGSLRHGTVGLGVGETILDAEILGDSALRARDLGKPWLMDKIELIRQHKLQQLAAVLDRIDHMPHDSREEADILRDLSMVYKTASAFNEMSELVRIVDNSRLGEVLSSPGTVVFEPSQGVLLDRWNGWHPHTTKVETTSQPARVLLGENGYRGEVTTLGITRAYQTRHGAGPFVTEDPTMTELLQDVSNGENEWQGRLRVGPLDIPALRYAIAASGGTDTFDGIVMTCLDRVAEFPEWKICDYYEGDAPDGLFMSEGDKVMDIRVRPSSRDLTHLKHQEQLGRQLRTLRPHFQHLPMGDVSIGKIGEALGVPITVTSHGPTESDKKTAWAL